MIWLYIIYYPILNSIFFQPINGIGTLYYTYIKSAQIETSLEIKGSPFKYYNSSYITIGEVKTGIRAFHSHLLDIYGGGSISYTILKMEEGKENNICYGYYLSLKHTVSKYGGISLVYEKIDNFSIWGISLSLRLQ